VRVAVIIPVGPGHGVLSDRAVASVYAAWVQTRGPFAHMNVTRIQDQEGKLGRSRARNQGMDAAAGHYDWHFLLDADDMMMPDAFSLVDLTAPATFGAVCLNGQKYRWDVQPCTREILLRMGAHGTLSMGCFLKGDLGLRFDEDLDVAEDFDFYMRLPGWTKRKEPLVSIGYNDPSAGGPRGYEEIDWVKACNRVIHRYRRTRA
jgi:glycosyltransferase involved in cell wall biosynthesis